MRRLAPLLLLCVLGCGGSDVSSGPSAVLALDAPDGILGAGVDGAGNPVLVEAIPGVGLRKASLAGTSFVALPDLEVSADPVVTRSFTLIPGSRGGTDGCLIVDQRTGESRFNAGDFPAAYRDDRVVWEASGGFFIEGLDGGSRLPLSGVAADSVLDIAGNWALLERSEGVDGTLTPRFSYRLARIGGQTASEYATPADYTLAAPRWINAAGESLGAAYAGIEGGSNDFPRRIVRWAADGTPSVPLPRLKATPLALADDGTAVVQEYETGNVRALRGGALGPTIAHADSAQEVFASRGGRFVFVADFERGRIAAYLVR